MHGACADRLVGCGFTHSGVQALLRTQLFLLLFSLYPRILPQVQKPVWWWWISPHILLEMGTLLMITGTLWVSLLVYNFITALFGINTFRGKYIDLLRWLYRVKITRTLYVVSIK